MILLVTVAGCIVLTNSLVTHPNGARVPDYTPEVAAARAAHLALHAAARVGGLIRLDWETLARQVTLRYFSPGKDYTGSPDEVWEQGENITCFKGENSLKFIVTPPPNFDSTKAVKLLTHGFTDSVINAKTQFVKAWQDYHSGGTGVILLDWSPLAAAGQFAGTGDYVYDLAARNSMDVGEFTGRCLASLLTQTGLQARDLHMVGHSLGGQLVGKAGRTMAAAAGGAQPGRVTGLDPAGPRFVDGPVLSAIPELELLSVESAEFVDVIHTNGGLKPAAASFRPRFGALQQLGHRDFYPEGGAVQPGCINGQDAVGGGCSHSRAVLYYFHSLREPDLFPSQACDTVERCNAEEAAGPAVTAYMGERAAELFTGQRELLYSDITNCHWNFAEHNNWWCIDG